MTPFGRFLEQYFPIFIEIGISFCVLCLGASIVYRLLKGKGFWMKARGQIRFHEWFGSGHSHRGWFTRIIGRAQNCLAVTVTDTELVIRPWFPFNLYFFAEMFDFEHRVPLANVASIQARQGAWGQSYLDIEFALADGRTRRFSLALRKREGFLKALRLGMEKSALGSEARIFR